MRSSVITDSVRPDEWKTRGLCVDRIDEFDAPGRQDPRRFTDQIETCHRCPVLEQCRIDAVRTRADGGIRAGVLIRSGHARNETLRAMAVEAGIEYVPAPGTHGNPSPCGTYGAYLRHLKAGQKPCEQCRLANVRQSAKKRAAS